MQELATRSEMSKSLINGVGGVGGGIALLIVAGLATSSWVFWVAAGICAVAGVGMILSKKQKKAGIVMAGTAVVVGIAGLLTIALGPWVAGLAGIGLIALGGFSLYKFFRDLKKRT
jgi:hypothetical protein